MYHSRHRPIAAPHHKRITTIPPRFRFAFFHVIHIHSIKLNHSRTLYRIEYCAQGFFCLVSPAAANRFSPALDIIVSLFSIGVTRNYPPTHEWENIHSTVFFSQTFVIRNRSAQDWYLSSSSLMFYYDMTTRLGTYLDRISFYWSTDIPFRVN